MIKKIKVISIFFVLILISCIFSYTYATENFSSNEENLTVEENTNNVIKDISNLYNLDEFVGTIQNSVNEMEKGDFNFNDIADGVISNKGVDYNSLLGKVAGIFGKEVLNTLKGGISIFIIVIIMAIMSSLELEKKSEVTKIAHLACFITLATFTITNFLEIINMFKGVVGTVTTIMQVISPFLMSVLIATGAISTTGVIQPLLLFLASSIGFIINYVVIPFLTISVAFNVICSISENLKLDKLSKLFNSSALWIVGVVLTLFLGVLSLETSLSSSVDSLGIKTTQAAVSNFVPVVGKFFSDSFETVVGATKIVGKTGGIIGIIAILVITSIPIIKIASVVVVYKVLGALIEPISTNEVISKYINSFADIYKTLLGVLIGITILFVISTGIILNLVNSVVK